MDVDYRWWALFVGNIAVGMTLVFFGDDGLRTLGVGCLGAALGQGATSKMGPTR